MSRLCLFARFAISPDPRFYLQRIAWLASTPRSLKEKETCVEKHWSLRRHDCITIIMPHSAKLSVLRVSIHALWHVVQMVVYCCCIANMSLPAPFT
jgi:hypothetical protein